MTTHRVSIRAFSSSTTSKLDARSGQQVSVDRTGPFPTTNLDCSRPEVRGRDPMSLTDYHRKTASPDFFDEEHSLAGIP